MLRTEKTIPRPGEKEINPKSLTCVRISPQTGLLVTLPSCIVVVAAKEFICVP